MTDAQTAEDDGFAVLADTGCGPVLGSQQAGGRFVQRIAIVGSGGAGKTVLANRLSTHLDLPVTHLDALRYDSCWQVVPEPQFVAAQQAVIAGERWIIDGNSLASMPIRFAAADTIIFLDLPPLVCLSGILVRRLRYRGGQHADGVYDRITIAVLRYVLSFRRRFAPRVRACIAEHGPHATLIEVTSRRQADQLIARLGHDPTDG
ncbi:topology modulation protein [Dactylosporangium sp. CA-152071]|uniref:topology modulation protein n=1 Tax=Dactylosporangium sp. CA-152071 TaxID=3239933 RepID=UPI003D9348AE